MVAKKQSHQKQKIRYAVVGLGYIAQVAVLPSFRHSENSELVALISDDPIKQKQMSRKYKASKVYFYKDYDECLKSGEVDAVYIALPNSLHCEYAVRAAEAGVHVLCEKPMAVTEDECLKMIQATEENDVKLMIAYRLHFEKANMKAVEIAQSGKLGDLRIFNSLFTMQVKEGNIRLQKELGGGTLYDIGIYCINAARYIFQDEPTEVFCQSSNNGDVRFWNVDEMSSAILRFPQDRLASFTTSFGASNISSYHVVGTKGNLRLDPAYEYAEELKHELTIGKRHHQTRFPQRDQFAPELDYFSQCILENEEPEPSGLEGLQDVRIIEALYRSANSGMPIKIEEIEKNKRPSMKQEESKPPVQRPELIHAESPSS